MPDRRRTTCRACGKHRTAAGPISWRGKCVPCAKRRVVENLEDLHAHRGVWFHNWRAAMAASVGAVLLDEAPADTHTRPES